MSRKLFGGRPAAVVSLVDAPVSRSFAQRSRVAFWVSAVVGGALSAAVLSAVLPVMAAVLVGALVGVGCGLVVGLVVRVWPVLRVLWWWSLEITLVGLAVLVPAVLARLTYPWLALALVAAVAAVMGVVRPVRRVVVAWSWCVVVRHRLRLCFSEFVRAASRTHRASLPLILWARPTPAGERVWVWLRPGLDMTDLDGKTGKLAVACWAGEARVVRASTRYAALVRFDVSRRDPLTGKVASPLAVMFAPPVQSRPRQEVSWAGLDLGEVPEPPVEAPRNPRSR